MPSIQRVVLAVLFAVPLTAAAAVFALPGPAACALAGATGMRTLADGSRTHSASEADHRRYAQLSHDARARIEAAFGAAEAKPVVIFFNGPEGFGPFRLNGYGSTQMIGGRSCVLIGPQGQNVDVVAHELMHAELHARTGYLAYFLQVPTWFDEGVAMQVDHRPAYALSPQASAKAGYVRALTTSAAFADADEKGLTRNYASAKAVVAGWVANAGQASLYPRLDRLKSGQPFAEVFPESELALRSGTLPGAQ